MAELHPASDLGRQLLRLSGIAQVSPNSHNEQVIQQKESILAKAKEAAINVAEAKRQFSDLLGRVAYGGETILITRRGRPMARLVPPDQPASVVHPADIDGWLAEDDPFFAEIDAIVRARARHRPRVLGHEEKDEYEGAPGIVEPAEKVEPPSGGET